MGLIARYLVVIRFRLHIQLVDLGTLFLSVLVGCDRSMYGTTWHNTQRVGHATLIMSLYIWLHQQLPTSQRGCTSTRLPFRCLISYNPVHFLSYSFCIFAFSRWWGMVHLFLNFNASIQHTIKSNTKKFTFFFLGSFGAFGSG